MLSRFQSISVIRITRAARLRKRSWSRSAHTALLMIRSEASWTGSGGLKVHPAAVPVQHSPRDAAKLVIIKARTGLSRATASPREEAAPQVIRIEIG
ncbi:MAG: hypothetical protein IPL18_15045 [Sphingomonadales bacterium]|nr:hypothetical protein [Sphingomonadales bacterium]